MVGLMALALQPRKGLEQKSMNGIKKMANGSWMWLKDLRVPVIVAVVAAGLSTLGARATLQYQDAKELRLASEQAVKERERIAFRLGRAEERLGTLEEIVKEGAKDRREISEKLSGISAALESLRGEVRARRGK